MMFSRGDAAKRTATLLLAAFLSSCGGGGGGGSSQAPSPVAPPGPPASLVPPPPPLGTILVNDARDLRPLRASASYRYRGKDFTLPSSQGVNFTAYTNVVMQATDANGIREVANNLFNDGADEIVVRNDPDRVVILGDLLITPAVTVNGFTGTELRSPVRMDDQIVLLERFDISLGVDVDGDGRIDWADVALYSRVIGQEDVTLATEMVVSAVRLDTTAKFRVNPSSGAAPVTVAQVQSEWYATGIGVVKRTIGSDGGSQSVDYEETLLAWDGLTDGLGFTDAVELRTPGNGEAIVSHQGAAGFGDSMLIFSQRGPLTTSFGMRVTKTDLRGRVQSSTEFPNLPGSISSISVVADSARAYVVAPNTRVPGLALIRFDRDGNPVDGPSGGVDLPIGTPTEYPRLAENRTGLALVGQELWVLWLQTALVDSINSEYEDQIVIRVFDLNGQPVSAAQVLASAPIGHFMPPPALHAQGNEGVASFLKRDLGASNPTPRIVKLSRTVGGFATATSEATGQLTTGTAIPVSGPANLGVVWLGRQDDGTSSIGQLALHAVALDPAGSLLRAGSGSNFDTEMLPASVFGLGTVAGSASAGGAWLMLRKAGRMWPQDVNEQPLCHVALQRFGAPPWATSGQLSTVLRTPDLWTNDFRTVLPLADRLILLSSTNNEQPMQMRTVWLRGL